MPHSYETKKELDKFFLQELQEKCAFLGIRLTEKEFRKNPDTYISAAKQYDDRVETYLYERRNQLQALQRQFMKEENMPAAIALGKARMMLTTEVHRQILAEKMSEAGRNIFNKEFDISGSDLTLKKNKELLQRLADASDNDASTLADKLKNAPNVSRALRDSIRPHELQKLALHDKNIQNTALAMAAFSPKRQTPAEFMIETIRETAARTAPTTGAVQTPPRMAADIIKTFSAYKDNLSGRILLDERAKTLTKKANFEYMQKMLSDLGIHGTEINRFKLQLSRHDGTLRDFLTQYGAAQIQKTPAETEKTQDEVEMISAEEREKQHRAEEKRQKEEMQKRKRVEQRALKEIEKKELRKAAEALKKEKAAQRLRKKQEEKRQRLLLKAERKEANEIKRQEKIKAKDLRRQQEIKKKAARQAQKEKLRQEKEARRIAEKQRQAEIKQQKKTARLAQKEKLRQEKEARRIAEKQRRTEIKQQKKAARLARRRARKELFKKAISSFYQQIKKPFVRKAPKEQKQPQMLILTPKRRKPSLWDRLFNRKKLRREEQRFNTITLNIENYKKQKQDEKKAKILKFKQKVRNTGRKTLKYAAIGAPLATMGYFGYKQLQNTGKAFDFSPITSTIRQSHLAEDIFDQATICYDKALTMMENQGQEYMFDINWELPWNEKKAPIDENDYAATVPYIQNDKMHNVPNADFFNKCFAQSNDYYGASEKYGISETVYRNFMYKNRAFANFYKIGSYKNLSYDEARIIAKTEFFDKYSIGFIQNSSIASYLYYILLKNEYDAGSVSAIADAVANFYNLKGKSVTEKQQQALKNISSSDTPKSEDWHELVAMINALSTQSEDERNLYKAIQLSQFNTSVPYIGIDTEKYMQQTTMNALFAYEPTFEIEKQEDFALFNSFADISIFYDFYTSKDSVEDEQTVLEKQKQKDIETFSKIYAQCSFNNVVKLSYGEKSEAFREADRSLAKNGIQGRIHRGLYCAGMSMASLCEAYDIFQRENPNSLVGESIKHIIDRCRINAHSSTGMRDIIAKYSDHIVYSGNLENDIKAYMEEHPYSIVQAGFRRNAAGNQHYNNFFPAFNSASTDSYTYCAYNNNHWGNEKTFASVLRDRRRAHYGNKGWYVDITAWIDDETNHRIDRELNKREQLRQERENQAQALKDSLQNTQSVSWSINLSNKFFGRN